MRKWLHNPTAESLVLSQPLWIQHVALTCCQTLNCCDSLQIATSVLSMMKLYEIQFAVSMLTFNHNSSQNPATSDWQRLYVTISSNQKDHPKTVKNGSSPVAVASWLKFPRLGKNPRHGAITTTGEDSHLLSFLGSRSSFFKSLLGWQKLICCFHYHHDYG